MTSVERDSEIALELTLWKEKTVKCLRLASEIRKTAFQIIHDTSRQQLGLTLPDTVNTVKCS
jgi:hypothetical protein